MIVSKSKRDKAMHIICNYFNDKAKKEPDNCHISSKYLIYEGFPDDNTVELTLDKLAAMQYITYDMSHPAIPEKIINITSAGRIYFEIQRDNKIDFIKKSILVPIGVTISTLILKNLLLDFFPDWLSKLLR